MARLSPGAFASMEQAISRDVLGQDTFSLSRTFGIGTKLEEIASNLTFEGATSVDNSQDLSF